MSQSLDRKIYSFFKQRGFYTPPDKVFVDPAGSDTYGFGIPGFPVATLSKAFTMVRAARPIVVLAPGAYNELAPVAWPTVRGIAVLGPGSDFCSITVPIITATSVITVTPGIQTSTFTGVISGVSIIHQGVHPTHGQAGITFDNTGITRNIVFNIKNCAFLPNAVTDKSINMATHTDPDHAVRIYVSGNGNQTEIGGAVYFEVNNLADRLHCEQLWFKGTITTPNVAKEMRIRLYKCIVQHENATAGGNATQVITSVGSHSWVDYNDIVPEVYAALDSADLTGSHSEVIVA